MSEKYNREDLSKDLFLLVKAGLLEINIRDDGEWLYSVSEKGKALNDEEKLNIIANLDDYEDASWDEDGE